MNKKSAGILVYRLINSIPEFMLVHPGGPFYKNKDIGCWSIPKGEFDEEDPFLAAKREFFEETGKNIEGSFIKLNLSKMKSGKLIFAWAVESNFDCHTIKSNTFQLEWPPKSGKIQEFPEIDKANWFITSLAIKKIHESQITFIEQLLNILKIENKNKDRTQGDLFS